MQKSASENRWTELHEAKISSVSKSPVQIHILKQTAEYLIVVFLYIRSDNIAYHIIDADIYHEAFA